MINLSGISDFSQNTWEDLGCPTNVTVVAISGWAERSIGSLNVKLNTEFCTTSGQFTPPFGNTEYAIYLNMYKVKYFQQRVFESLNGIIDNDEVDWSSLREGDSLITRSNRSELVKQYRVLQDSATQEVNRLVSAYHRNVAMPLEVYGIDGDFIQKSNYESDYVRTEDQAR